MGSINKEKILFVDDDENLLAGVRRQLSRKFAIDTALGAVEAIKKLGSGEDYAVIVSDMRMPGMDGVQFLRVARQRFPNSVRVMLTGNADFETAMNAVNEGSIFRFITKPCPALVMETTLDACIEQYRLISAEKYLLESTVNGSIKVLVDILSITNPRAFSRATRIKHFVVQLARRLALPDIWQYEMAALLSQIGFVIIPADTLEKIYANQKISTAELEMIKRYPQVGSQIVGNIPRLETVAQMIAKHQDDFNKEFEKVEPKDRPPAEIGAEMLRVAAHFDTFLFHSGTANKGEALLRMKKNAAAYNPHLLAILDDIDFAGVDREVISVKIRDLQLGMVIYDNIVTNDGMLIATKGQEVTEMLRLALDAHAQQGKINDTIIISK